MFREHVIRCPPWMDRPAVGPERVHVVALEARRALVWFPTPASFGRAGLWDLADYMHVHLRREGAHWVVDWAKDRSAPPVH